MSSAKEKKGPATLVSLQNVYLMYCGLDPGSAAEKDCR
jgi:hypothetical protein